MAKYHDGQVQEWTNTPLWVVLHEIIYAWRYAGYVELFTTMHTTKLFCYMSSIPVPQEVTIDALSQSLQVLWA